MTSHTITIPAREVRPGDMLFGMTVKETRREEGRIWRSYFLMENDIELWLVQAEKVQLERPSEPIGTVRASFHSKQHPDLVFCKIASDRWERTDSKSEFSDADVADFPILWKPGMPIPTEGVQA